eukprot:947923-Prymnesium_polylepis.1
MIRRPPAPHKANRPGVPAFPLTGTTAIPAPSPSGSKHEASADAWALRTWRVASGEWSPTWPRLDFCGTRVSFRMWTLSCRGTSLLAAPEPPRQPSSRRHAVE